MCEEAARGVAGVWHMGYGKGVQVQALRSVACIISGISISISSSGTIMSTYGDVS